MKSKITVYPYPDVYEYTTLTTEQYIRRKNKNVWKAEWVVFHESINKITVRRVKA